MKFKLTKQEIKYILFSLAFAIVWFFLVLPNLSNAFNTINPFIQFILFNLGLYAFFFIFLKAMISETAPNLRLTTGLIFLFLALDTFVPEYHVDIQGNLIPGAILGTSATDYIWGNLAHLIGMSGFLVAFFTYV